MPGSLGPDRLLPVNLRRTPGTRITTTIRRYWGDVGWWFRPVGGGVERMPDATRGSYASEATTSRWVRVV